MFRRSLASSVPQGNYCESNGVRVCDPVGYPTLKQSCAGRTPPFSCRWTKAAPHPKILFGRESWFAYPRKSRGAFGKFVSLIGLLETSTPAGEVGHRRGAPRLSRDRMAT